MLAGKKMAEEKRENGDDVAECYKANEQRKKESKIEEEEKKKANIEVLLLKEESIMFSWNSVIGKFDSLVFVMWILGCVHRGEVKQGWGF